MRHACLLMKPYSKLDSIWEAIAVLAFSHCNFAPQPCSKFGSQLLRPPVLHQWECTSR